MIASHRKGRTSVLVNMRNTRPDQFRSADHPRADLKAGARHFANGPGAEVPQFAADILRRSVACRQPCWPCPDRLCV